jgi:hypothetical protein
VSISETRALRDRDGDPITGTFLEWGCRSEEGEGCKNESRGEVHLYLADPKKSEDVEVKRRTSPLFCTPEYMQCLNIGFKTAATNASSKVYAAENASTMSAMSGYRQILGISTTPPGLHE